MNKKYKNKKHLKSKKTQHDYAQRAYKTLEEMQYNELVFDDIERQVKNSAKKLYGNDIFDNYYLPDNFNFYKLTPDMIRPHNLQEHLLPYSNKQIDNLIKMPKIAINKPISFNSQGRHIDAIFLLGQENAKNVLYVLKIGRSCQYNCEFNDFHLELYAYVQGKTWLSLLRLDSMGYTHLNYIVNGKVAKSNEEVTRARTPHLHKCTYECQVLTNRLGYSLAEELDYINYSKLHYGKEMFLTCLNNFTKLCNADVKFDQRTSLFDKNYVKVNKKKDLKEIEWNI